MDQQPQQPYRHYCRICKKGFGCGRALGGHMRAHGINDDLIGGHGADPDGDPSAGGEWDGRRSPPDGSKRMYALRANPNRLKSCRVCENCGMEFLSWKPFLEHGKCRPQEEGDDSPPSSPVSEGDEEDAGGQSRGCAGWSKGKRSRRTKAAAGAGTPITVCPSSEEEDLANCLVMLSAARVDPMAVVETEESCASASKEEDRWHTMERAAAAEKAKAPVPPVPRGMFECKACKKVFRSHQALGGHRASHKKVKGCFAAKLDDLDEPPPEEEATTHGGRRHHSDDMAAEMALAIVPFHNPPLAVAPLRKKAKVHECSICRRVFASGQALGGHKRCHWITSSSPDPAATAKLRPMPDHAGHHHPRLTLRPSLEPSEPLDLNLPAPADHPDCVRPDVGSSYRLEVPATLCLQPWTDQSHGRNNKKCKATAISNSIKSKNETSSADVADDEADSTIKLAKLSELKDVSIGSDASSNWLQVGIGSPSTNEGGDPA